MNVLFPLPFGPTRATSSPRRSPIDTPWTTTAFPYPPWMSSASKMNSPIPSLSQVRVDDAGVVHRRLGSAVEDQRPLVHHEDSLHVLEEHIEPVLNDQEREAVLLPQGDDRLEDLRRELRCNARRRLVEEHELRLAHEGAGHFEELHLAPGDVRRPVQRDRLQLVPHQWGGGVRCGRGLRALPSGGNRSVHAPPPFLGPRDQKGERVVNAP